MTADRKVEEMSDHKPAPHFGFTTPYLLVVTVGALLVTVPVAIGWSTGKVADIMNLLFALGLLLLTVSHLYFLVIIYRLWDFAISRARMHGLTPSIDRPGRAVGMLFVPMYGLFWAFGAFGKLTGDLNAVAKAGGSSDRMAVGVGAAVAASPLVFFVITSVLPALVEPSESVGEVWSVLCFVAMSLIAAVFAHRAVTFSRAL